VTQPDPLDGSGHPVVVASGSAADSAVKLGRDVRVGPEQLLALIDNTSSVIYMRDLDGRYMLINEEYERLFNLKREEIIGLTDHDLFPPAVADHFRANDLVAAQSGGPVQFEEVAPGEDGPHTYLTVKFPILDQSGQAYAIAGISTDITDRKRAEQEVQELNAQLEQRVRERTAELEASTKELDAFAYSVSHDLRAPLRSLHGFSQLLLEDYSDKLDEAGVAHLRRLQVNATLMAQLLDDLLRLSRTTRVELRRQSIDLTAMAESILRDLATDEPDRQVQASVEPSLRGVGDLHLIRLALQNLIANAWKFTALRETAEITVGSMMHGSQRVFFVRDNGAGFDSRYEGKLFEPFQRLHSATDFEGSGIGLAIVQRVVVRHGGSVWAESTPGQGATFFFTMTSFVPVPVPVPEPRGADAD
jgi:PAS domain S-box-containing protein